MTQYQKDEPLLEPVIILVQCVSSLTTSDLFVGVWAKPQLNVGGGLAGIGLASLMESFGIGVLDP